MPGWFSLLVEKKVLLELEGGWSGPLDSTKLSRAILASAFMSSPEDGNKLLWAVKNGTFRVSVPLPLVEDYLFLPKPVILDIIASGDPLDENRHKKIKEFRNSRYIRQDVCEEIFERIESENRENKSITLAEALTEFEDGPVPVVLPGISDTTILVSRNSLSRLSMKSTLFYEEVYCPMVRSGSNQGVKSVLVCFFFVAEEEVTPIVERACSVLGSMGIGKKLSNGRGRIKSVRIEDSTFLKDHGFDPEKENEETVFWLFSDMIPSTTSLKGLYYWDLMVGYNREGTPLGPIVLVRPGSLILGPLEYENSVDRGRNTVPGVPLWIKTARIDMERLVKGCISDGEY